MCRFSSEPLFFSEFSFILGGAPPGGRGRRPFPQRKKEKIIARGMAGAPSDWDVGERGFGGQGTRGMAPDFRRQAERFLILNVNARRREGFFHDLRDM